MRRVLLATPMYDSKADARYIHSFGLTIKACMENNIDLRWLFPWNDQIDNARNGIFRDVVKYAFDDLFWIDADQHWDPEWFLRLLAYPVDCVAGVVRRKDDSVEMYNVRSQGGPHSLITDPQTGLMTSPDMSVGFGFYRLSRAAFTAIWEGHKDQEYTVFLGKEPLRWICRTAPHKGELRGEDTYVCDWLREHGFQTWVDPKMNPGHIGLKDYRGDFLDWLERAKRDVPPPDGKVVPMRA